MPQLTGGTSEERARYETAVEDFGYIEKAMPQVRDEELHTALLQMQRVGGNILTYLSEHPERLPAARQFIDYYQDRAAKLLGRYLEIEKLQLDTPGAQSVRDRTKSLLAVDLLNAYKQQFEKIINHQLLDIDAEIKVLERSLKADGLDVQTRSPQALPLATDEDVRTALDAGTAEVEVTYEELRRRGITSLPPAHGGMQTGTADAEVTNAGMAARGGGVAVSGAELPNEGKGAAVTSESSARKASPKAVTETYTPEGIHIARPNAAPGKPSRTSGQPAPLPTLLAERDSWLAKAVGTLGIGDTVTERKYCAAFFAMFLGSFGLHKFYLGKNGWGLLYLLFFWTGIPGVLGFFEGMRFLLMTREGFYRNYC